MIVKQELKENFTIVSNEIIRSKELSNNAKLLAVLLCSLPQNWAVNTQHLSKELNLGLRSVQRAFKELIDLNFIQKVQIIDEKTNKFTNSFSVVFIGKNEKEINQSLKDELKGEFVGQKVEARDDLNEILENESPNDTDLNAENETKEHLNELSNKTTNSRQAEICRTYVNHPHLRSEGFLTKANHC
ncbi:hypothetical protein DMB92_05345 [Campylobacter sp. MIT 99-7217]|uniref:helix-turn-helix domain-containing protein n=1 Tax=Campylobacter sp. MIT 99-7217 TaxID=535091 RepID=UPI00115BF623|nr:helix-turn-helix domain-containing protein [Campylobacter sp. MIT 99-7217]TQR31814.1 hypothetical protein DMB92_05345 [Campylobacter sp. MIT 99-7217]